MLDRSDAPIGRLTIVRDAALRLEFACGILAGGRHHGERIRPYRGLCVSTASGEPCLVPYAMLARLREGQTAEPQRGWLGASFQPVTLSASDKSLTGQGTGRLVVGVAPGGPADQAGLRHGDIILAIDGINMHGHGTLRSFLGPESLGRACSVAVLRLGTVLRTTLVVRPQPA